mmetsp:Transcript_8311/g.7361  ORF Transcript_8311/g.7361 Transcript_8311/m.7361 type:complete len:84 (+) Transcript_8311:1-252(+)
MILKNMKKNWKIQMIMTKYPNLQILTQDMMNMMTQQLTIKTNLNINKTLNQNKISMLADVDEFGEFQNFIKKILSDSKDSTVI